MAFSSQHLLDSLPAKPGDCLVAYSGGVDSHVMLHALCQLRAQEQIDSKIRAVHVHHGLSEDADSWTSHCQQICDSLNVPLEIVRVDVLRQGKGLEEAARNVRLAAFERMLNKDEMLLMAHHQDDQVETQLFRIMRGTGLRGLAGIKKSRVFGQGTIFRPLLNFSREELLDYAGEEKLHWIEDESNQDDSLDRNFLRKNVIPLIAKRWPGFRKNWQRLAQLADEGQQILQDVGDQDLLLVREKAHRLSIPELLTFSPLRQRNILRSWFLSLEHSHCIPAPDFYVIDRILSELVPAAEDGQPEVTWSKSDKQMEARRFGNRIYLVVTEPGHSDQLVLKWQPDQDIQLPGQLGVLRLIEAEKGIELPEQTLDICFRQGGENVKPAGRKTRSLKKILQDYEVPPWLRAKIPLIYHESELMAVGDLFICDGWQIENTTEKSKKLYRFQWEREDLHCGY